MAYNKETGMYEGFIYKICSDVDDIFYIGRTYRTIHKRWIDHLLDAKYKITKLYNAMNQYGFEHFNVECVEKFESKTKDEIKQLCISKEIFWIKYFKNQGFSLYNMTDGGKDYDGLNNSEKLVIMYDLFCNELQRFNSISEASEFSGVDGSAISSCCLKRGFLYSTKDVIWRYIDEPLTEDEINELNKRYPGCCQYDFSGNLLNTFYRISEAVSYLNSNGITAAGANIGACMEGRKKSAYDFIWRYRKDSFDKYPLPKRPNYVEQRTLDGELINVFTNCSIAAKETGVSINAIRCCCQGLSKTGGDYVWCRQGTYCAKDIPVSKKSVDRYDLNFNYIDSFKSMSEASRATGINSRSIGFVCSNDKRYKTAGGYIWRFSGDDISTYLYYNVAQESN